MERFWSDGTTWSEQVDRLRAQAEALMAVRSGADIAGSAARAPGTTDQGADAFSGKSRGTLVALVIATGLGFLIGRALR